MVNNPPWIRWHIQCYHYETRVRTSTDAEGNTTTTTTEERVNTHSASHSYQLQGWRDDSNPLKPTSHSIAKVAFSKDYKWRDPRAKQKHDGEKFAWIARNDRDTHKDFSWSWGIHGYKSHMIEVRAGEAVPCCFNLLWFWLFSLLGLSWIYRVWASSVTGKRNEGFLKVGW